MLESNLACSSPVYCMRGAGKQSTSEVWSLRHGCCSCRPRARLQTFQHVYVT